MQLVKPAWVNYDGKPIFSIDIHPNGERFATGGQGADSGRVIIWNTSPIFCPSSENDPNTPKLLCQMDNHLACVNSVRWNGDGNLLASGGDDKLVMVWKLVGAGSAVLGGKFNYEQWRCVGTLRGHSGDVLDLAWAPNGNWLASCSVDNDIIIWNANNLPEVITIIKGHESLVKGIAWDPIGKFLASQSDDRSVRVWRTGQWTEEVSVTGPFEECSGTTSVLRLSWSPDGQYLVSAHAMNGGGPTAVIIEREGWKQDKDFVGHRKAVTCVKFNGNIFQKRFQGSAKPQQYSCCAIGSKDKSLTVWLTSLKRPLFVIQNVFTSSVLDITWSACGYTLMACSWDGTVVCIRLKENELGKCLSVAEKNTLFERLYGKSYESPYNSNQLIMETPEILVTRNKLLKDEAAAKLSQRVKGADAVKADHLNMPRFRNPTIDETATLKTAFKQIETRSADGKRRITPMILNTPTTPSKDLLKETTPEQTQRMDFRPTTPEPLDPKPQIIINEHTPTSDVRVDRDWKTRPSEIRQEILQSAVGQTPNPPIQSSNDNLMSIKVQAQGDTIIATNNHTKSSKGVLSRLHLIKATSTDAYWETYFGANITTVASSANVTVVGCDDSLVYTIKTKTGQRILPPFMTTGVSVITDITPSNRCLLITKMNNFYLWDLFPEARAVAENKLPPTFTVSSCKFSKNDDAILTLTTGLVLCFDVALNTWLVLMDPKDPLCHYVVPGPLVKKNLGGYPLAMAQKSGTRVIKPLEPATAALAHLEAQMAAALTLKSPEEYRYWLKMYVKWLLNKCTCEGKLRAVLDDLLGPSGGGASWKSHVLGFKKHTLLEEVLELFGCNLRWQRLYTEYHDQL